MSVTFGAAFLYCVAISFMTSVRLAAAATVREIAGFAEEAEDAAEEGADDADDDAEVPDVHPAREIMLAARTMQSNFFIVNTSILLTCRKILCPFSSYNSALAWFPDLGSSQTVRKP